MNKKLSLVVMAFLSTSVIAKNYCSSLGGKWISVTESEKIIVELSKVNHHHFSGDGFDTQIKPSKVHLTGQCQDDNFSLSSQEGTVKAHMLSKNSFSIGSDFLFKKIN